MVARFESSLKGLIRYCERFNWKGYDPYDGLNSRVFNLCPVKNKFTRTAFIQLLKRSPVNFRQLLMVESGFNPKGLGLFALGSLRLYREFKTDEYKSKALCFLDLLKHLSLKGYSGYCWGYNFDWQSRAFFVPKRTPNIVTTSFIANAFLDAYEALQKEEFLDIGRSSCEFILKDLKRTTINKSFCFSYTPLDNSCVYNAAILGARLLGREYSLSHKRELLDSANKAVNFVIEAQNSNGSWYYGKADNQKWIDNFHTGFILEALHDFIKSSRREELKENLIKGLKFYKNSLFLDNGIPKYFHDKLYPIDIHSCAQGIITFAKLRNFEKDNLAFAEKIAQWTIDNMQDESGYFYYQRHRYYTNKIPYMRWSQAWMFYALSCLRGEAAKNETKNH